MTTAFFHEWLRKLDAKFAAKKHKGLRFVDNCSAHVSIHGLKTVRLEFFLQNATSVLQPMDQGIGNTCYSA